MTLDTVRKNPRKKALAGVILLIIFLLVWQISSMFGKAASSPPNGAPVGKASVAVAEATPATPQPPPPPKQAVVPQTTPMTEREAALVTMQQETQIKYLQAVNELQLLKVNRDIAQTNKDISSANLDKVSNDKKVIELLVAPVTAATTTVTTTQEGGPGGEVAGAASSLTGEASFSVVSISQVQYRWGAVLSYRGTLYNVHVGDVLSDGSAVIAISKDSVTLQKNGVRKKVSLVSII